ncbi:MAG: sensor histidine kinase [Oscillospiraceae bacterium]
MKLNAYLESLLPAIKAVYENMDQKVLVTNEKLYVAWKNDDTLPELMSIYDFGKYYNKDLKLPIEESAILHYTDEYTVKVNPIKNDDEVCGYLFMFFDAEDVETMYDRSVHYKYKDNRIRRERKTLIPMLTTLENFYISKEPVPYDFYETAKDDVTHLLASNVNYNEITNYYNGKMYTELFNISNCLEETSQIFQSRLSDDCIFRTEIQPAMFINMSSDCLMNVVLNLLVNAYMYNDNENKEIVLKAYSKNDSMVYIDVWDNGITFDIDALKKASVPFHPLEKPVDSEGLGLPLARKFAEHFGGRLDFLATKEGGLIVRLVLKAAEESRPLELSLRYHPLMVGDFEPAACIVSKANFQKNK